MTAPSRSKAARVAALLSAAILAGCGDSSSDGSSGDSTASPASSRAAAEKIIAQAIGTNEEAGSARLDGTIDIVAKGVSRFEGTTQLTANGFYDLRDGADVPDFDIDVGVSLNGHALGGGILVADGKGYITLGNSGYKLPEDINRTLIAPAPDAKNGLTKTAAMFYINPQDWQENARLVGDATVAGESVQHIKADISAERFFEDLSRLVRFLTTIKVTQALGLPEALGPKVRAALTRSVTVATGEVWIGKDDHVLRRARAQGRLVVAEKDRTLLSGLTNATLDANINISEVGDEHPVSVPKQLDSYSSLELSLDALGEAVQNQNRGR